MKPDSYSYTPMRGKYFRETSDEFEPRDEAYTVRFHANGSQQCSATYFPEKNGIKIETDENLGYEDGKLCAIFGAVSISLIGSGFTFVEEL